MSDKKPLDQLAEAMIKIAEHANATTHSVRWFSLNINPEWDLKVSVIKRKPRKRKKVKHDA